MTLTALDIAMPIGLGIVFGANLPPHPGVF